MHPSLLTAWQTFSFETAILVCLAYLVIDGLYAKYTLDVTRYNEYRAANIGVFMHFLMAFGIINYTENWLYILPLAVGSWIGTYFTIRRERVRNEAVETE